MSRCAVFRGLRGLRASSRDGRGMGLFTIFLYKRKMGHSSASPPPRLISTTFDEGGRTLVFEGDPDSVRAMQRQLRDEPGLGVHLDDAGGPAHLLVRKACLYRDPEELVQGRDSTRHGEGLRDATAMHDAMIDQLTPEGRREFGDEFQKRDLAASLLAQVMARTPVDLGVAFHATLHRGDAGDFYPTVSLFVDRDRKMDERTRAVAVEHLGTRLIVRGDQPALQPITSVRLPKAASARDPDIITHGPRMSDAAAAIGMSDHLKNRIAEHFGLPPRGLGGKAPH
jgi:hypothetical protein